MDVEELKQLEMGSSLSTNSLLINGDCLEVMDVLIEKGIELDEDYFQIASNRIEQALEGSSLSLDEAGEIEDNDLKNFEEDEY